MFRVIDELFVKLKQKDCFWTTFKFLSASNEVHVFLHSIGVFTNAKFWFCEFLMIPHEIPHIFCVRKRWNCQNCSIITILKSRSKSAKIYGAGLSKIRPLYKGVLFPKKGVLKGVLKWILIKGHFTKVYSIKGCELNFFFL